jgi:hypothetical protein
VKQVIVLEPDDVQRLKHGETLQLTGSLMLSLQTTRKYKVNGVADNPEGLTAKQIYQRNYRKTYKRKPVVKPQTFPCAKCGKEFTSKNALAPHQFRCKGKMA